MARRVMLSIYTVLAAAGAWWLRTQQRLAGFEAESGLPLPGDRWGWFLWGLLALTLAVAVALTLPEQCGGGSFAARFRSSALGAVFQLSGMALLLACGGKKLLDGVSLSAPLDAVLGAAVLLSAVCLLPAVRGCLGRESRWIAPCLLLPMGAAALALALRYRANAGNPVLAAFDMEMLALLACALTALQLCTLAYQEIGLRRFLIASALTVVCCGAALADEPPLWDALGLVGCALTAYGFGQSLLYRTERSRRRARPTAETAAPPMPVETSPADDGFDPGRVDRLLRELSEE